MGIHTNLPSLQPARKRLAKEITLLSKGYLNRKAFPDGKITVYPWDLNINEALAKRSYDGDSEAVLVDLLPLMCNLNGATAEDFFVSELMLILMVSYAQGQNGRVNMSTQCPFCGEPVKESIQVPDNLERVGEKATDWPGFDTVTLPESKDVIKFRPLTVRDLKKIKSRTKEQRLLIKDEIYRCALHLVAVGNGKEEGAPTDMNEAAQYIEALTMADIRAFLAAVAQNSPKLLDVVHIKCVKCEKESSHNLNLDTKFFL